MSNKSYDKYIETTEFPGNTHLQVSVYYSLGGGINGRGFYLSITPVTKGNNMISYTLFTGYRQFIMPAKRFSQKQLELAIEKSKEYEQILIDKLKADQKAA